MPKLTIDKRDVEVPAGATILDAALRLGIPVPTLCYLDGCTPGTSCMVCVVKVKNPDRFLPSCGMRAEEGMEVESETDEVREARRQALELLLSDHPGDCIAPCQSICPARMDIPKMIRQAAAGDFAAAAATARATLVLPATLGRVCPAPCEKGCRRADLDAPLTIRLLHRRAADTDLASGASLLPPCKPSTGKRAAVIGAGPAGLAAAWHLLQEGVACTILDECEHPGGVLRQSAPESHLPLEVLDAEIALIARLGAEFRMRTRVGQNIALADLQKEFDAVLIASGTPPTTDAGPQANMLLPEGVQVDRHTFKSSMPGLFAAGDIVHHHRMAVRGVADGAVATRSILQFLAGAPVTAPRRAFSTHLHEPTPEEMARLAAGASANTRVSPGGGDAAGLTPEEARQEAPRCLHCDCRKAHACKLRDYSDAYGASPGRYHGTRRPFEQDMQHANVVYESGKCISCGLCIQIAARAKEPLGLTLIGRGFSVRVGVPFSTTIAEGLKKAAAECVAACPTGALAHK